MVPLVRVIGVAIWGSGWWLVLTPQHWHGQPSYPLLKEQLGSAFLGAQWTDK